MQPSPQLKELQQTFESQIKNGTLIGLKIAPFEGKPEIMELTITIHDSNLTREMQTSFSESIAEKLGSKPVLKSSKRLYADINHPDGTTQIRVWPNKLGWEEVIGRLNETIREEISKKPFYGIRHYGANLSTQKLLVLKKALNPLQAERVSGAIDFLQEHQFMKPYKAIIDERIKPQLEIIRESIGALISYKQYAEKDDAQAIDDLINFTTCVGQHYGLGASLSTRKSEMKR